MIHGASAYERKCRCTGGKRSESHFYADRDYAAEEISLFVNSEDLACRTEVDHYAGQFIVHLCRHSRAAHIRAECRGIVYPYIEPRLYPGTNDHAVYTKEPSYRCAYLFGDRRNNGRDYCRAYVLLNNTAKVQMTQYKHRIFIRHTGCVRFDAKPENKALRIIKHAEYGIRVSDVYCHQHS